MTKELPLCPLLLTSTSFQCQTSSISWHSIKMATTCQQIGAFRTSMHGNYELTQPRSTGTCVSADLPPRCCEERGGSSRPSPRKSCRITGPHDRSTKTVEDPRPWSLQDRRQPRPPQLPLHPLGQRKHQVHRLVVVSHTKNGYRPRSLNKRTSRHPLTHSRRTSQPQLQQPQQPRRRRSAMWRHPALHLYQPLRQHLLVLLHHPTPRRPPLCCHRPRTVPRIPMHPP
jgi:hypothetical protein